jgi:hypothetical protein
LFASTDGRIRRHFSALWLLFEVRLNETMEKIRRLQVCVENDACATAIAQQQMESSNFARQLSELKTAANFTVRSVLEPKQCQTAILLMGIPARYSRR